MKLKRFHFNKQVTKVGGRERAAQVMGVTPETVSLAMQYGPDGDEGGGEPKGTIIGEARLLELQRATGTLKAPPAETAEGHAPRQVYLSLDELLAIRRYEIGVHPDGFQRPLNESYVASIEAAVREAGSMRLGPIDIGELPDGVRVEIDGGHRRGGCMRAGVGCLAVIYPIRDLEEARRLYLARNGKRLTPKAEELYLASRNPATQSMRVLQDFYGLSFSHAQAVVGGALARRLDFVDEHFSIDPVTQRRIEAVLDVWTRHRRRGKPEERTFNDPRFLRALAYLARDYEPDMVGEVVQLACDASAGLFRRDGTWTELLSAPRKLTLELVTYVNPRLFGGVTDKRRKNSRGSRRGT